MGCPVPRELCWNLTDAQYEAMAAAVRNDEPVCQSCCRVLTGLDFRRCEACGDHYCIPCKDAAFGPMGWMCNFCK